MSAAPEPGPAPIATHAGLREAPGGRITGGQLELALGGLLALLRTRRLPHVVAVARDARPSSGRLADAAVELLLSRGADVVDMGAVSTPAAKLAARRRRLGGLAMVTGSHLAPELNGLKISAAPLFKPVDHRRLPPPEPRSASRGGLTRVLSAAEEHVEAVAAAVDERALQAAALRVSCTGGPDSAGPALLARLGCTAVDREDGADLGFALDPDGDRLTLAAADGLLDSEATLPLVAMARTPRLVVRSSDTSRSIDLLLSGRARVEVVPPGELRLIDALLRQADGELPALAGEGNGGVVVPEVGLARDGLASAATVLELVARSGGTLAELAAELPSLVRRRSTVRLPPGAAATAALEAAASLPGAGPGPGGDGVLVERGGGLWALARPSGTEPLLRITAEGPVDQAVGNLHAELRDAVEPALSERTSAPDAGRPPTRR